MLAILVTLSVCAVAIVTLSVLRSSARRERAWEDMMRRRHK